MKVVVLVMGVRDRVHPSLRDRDGPPRQVHPVACQNDPNYRRTKVSSGVDIVPTQRALLVSQKFFIPSAQFAWWAK